MSASYDPATEKTYDVVTHKDSYGTVSSLRCFPRVALETGLPRAGTFVSVYTQKCVFELG